MPRPNPASASSGWAWRAGGGALSPPPPPRRPNLLRGGGGGAALAAFVFVGVVGAAIFVTSRDGEEPTATAEASESSPDASADASEDPTESAADETGEGDEGRLAGDPNPAAMSLETITWTTEASTTLEELGRAWSIPQGVLAALNPDLAGQEGIEAGTKVVVYAQSLGTGFAIGSPNDGRLTWGVPLPEGDAWRLPDDRSRAFATAETIASVTEALDAYARRFPDAEPIQIGDLSARRGGEIYGHQSHRNGLDIDIRLIRDAAGGGFDPERNWFLVKSLIDGGRVRSIFLNVREQTWLRAAVEADVGADAATEYFELIDHEPGHTIHMHVRFACPEAHKRCVGYALSDSGEEVPKLSKLPGAIVRPTGKASKLPVLRPKGPPRASTTPKKGTPTKLPTSRSR
jgi:murein endopeptidase